jgi:NADPH:quinone reductase-like Zn-dependent oxidoreductase
MIALRFSGYQVERDSEREQTLKSYHATSGADLAGLVLREHDEPIPARHEVLIRLRATSLNAREILVLRGTYPLPVKPDVIMGADGAGEVVALGPDVTRVRVGDRVVATMFPRWIDGPITWECAPQFGGSLDGMMTEFIALSEDALVHLPEHLSFEEGATLPCAAVTAWNVLTGTRRLQAGDTVLTLGLGNVSLFALQFAKVSGARVIATTSSDEKAARLKAVGADAVINYRTTPDWHEAVRELTQGQGVDHVIEVGGGSLEQSIKATAFNGQINFIGRLSDAVSTIDTNVLYNAVATIRVIFAGSRAQFIAMNRAIDVNRLRPIIDRVFPFDDVLGAFRYYEKGQAFGKVVIKVD